MLLTETEPMAKKVRGANEPPVGRRLVRNLYRLGYGDIVIRVSEVADTVTKRTGQRMSRQRIHQMLNAIHVDPETIAVLAKGLGVKPADLLRDDESTAGAD